MDIIKIIGISLVAIIILSILKQYKKEFAIYVSLVAGLLIFMLVLSKMSGIIELLKNLANKTSINSKFLKLIIKISGISLLTEFMVSICKDFGESAIANKVDFGGKIIIMSLALPIMSSLLETILDILP